LLQEQETKVRNAVTYYPVNGTEFSKVSSGIMAESVGEQPVCCSTDRIQTREPTKVPSENPTTLEPTASPLTSIPTLNPTTSEPSQTPLTTAPTPSPSTSNPTTSEPSQTPLTTGPTQSPSTSKPSSEPTTSAPSYSPSTGPTMRVPTTTPTKSPSKSPETSEPTYLPTGSPTFNPSVAPTLPPSQSPTFAPLTCSESELAIHKSYRHHIERADATLQDVQQLVEELNRNGTFTDDKICANQTAVFEATLVPALEASSSEIWNKALDTGALSCEFLPAVVCELSTVTACALEGSSCVPLVCASHVTAWQNTVIKEEDCGRIPQLYCDAVSMCTFESTLGCVARF